MDCISGATGLEGLLGKDAKETDPQKLKLKQTCREFEAVMVSIVLKEGLSNAKEMGKVQGSDEEEDSGSKTFKEMAYEQMSYYIGKSGMLGLGDRLYDSMKDRVSASSTKNPVTKGSVE